jgi:glutathionylspermidine synthase
MERVPQEPRPGWEARVEEHGLLYHTLGGEPYWDESACYQFRPAEVDHLEHVTYQLYDMCLQVVQQVIDERLFGLFVVPPPFEDFVVRSWDEDEPSVYGRFDLAYDGTGPPKLLEYNADTPTALVEAAVTQWYWLQDTDPAADQFNGIHERLIEAWQALRAKDDSPVHFSAQRGVVEDYVTVEYLRDTAIQAGLDTDYLDVEQVGWNPVRRQFVDLDEQPIRRIFKLYPWEWLIREPFAEHLLRARTRWVEPPWKMLLSCKSILPLLYDSFPSCPYLLPASFDPLPGNYVKKPVHGREGSNITVVVDGQVVLETDGPYDQGPFVYQQLAPLRPFGGRWPVVGSWLVNGWACGMGIREDGSMITRNTSRFVPHKMVSL